jgi:hypothetical protein
MYRIRGVNPDCPGWKHVAGDYIWLRVVQSSASFDGDAYTESDELVLAAPDAATGRRALYCEEVVDGVRHDRVNAWRRRRADATASTSRDADGPRSGPNLCLPSGLPILTGGPLRARPRPSLSLRARGLANFSPSRSLTLAGKTSRPDLALRGPLPVGIANARRQKERAAKPQPKGTHCGPRT